MRIRIHQNKRIIDIAKKYRGISENGEYEDMIILSIMTETKEQQRDDGVKARKGMAIMPYTGARSIFLNKIIYM